MYPSRLLSALFAFLCCYGSVYAFSPTNSGGVVLSADSLWFGRVEANAVVDDTLWVKSASGSPFTLLSARIVARHSDFSLVSVPAFPATVADSVAVVVRYRSRHNVRREGSLFLRVEHQSLYSVAVRLSGESFYVNPAYEFTDNLQGKALVDALRSYVQGHTSLTYNQARDQMFGSVDKRPGDTLECPYSGKKIRAANRTEAQNQSFNTEHTWPQSVGAENEPPKSDMFHLRATDLTINDKRANFPFGYVVKDVQYEQGGSRLGKDANGATVFEVRDRYKGDIARGMFYFAVRYGNPSSYLNQQEAALRQWSAFDTVSAEESVRNAAIEKLQKRRNPFVDHPEFMERIYSLSGVADFPRIANPVVSDSAVVLLLPSPLDGVPVLFGNTGTDTAYVRSVELQATPGALGAFVSLVDSAVAPDGLARVHVRRPTAASSADSLVVTVRFAQGVPQKSVVVRFVGTTGVGEALAGGRTPAVVPNPFAGEAAVVLPAGLVCAEPVVRILTSTGGDARGLRASVEHGDVTTVRVRSDQSLSSGLYFCRIQCGAHAFTLPLYLMR